MATREEVLAHSYKDLSELLQEVKALADAQQMMLAHHLEYEQTVMRNMRLVYDKSDKFEGRIAAIEAKLGIPPPPEEG